VPTFDELVSEAAAAPFSGWDFSWLDWPQRRTGWLPWSYRREVARRAAGLAGPMLDMGTGGGERLSQLPSIPPQTVACEAWPPNVPVAATRLAPLGIPVVQDEGGRTTSCKATVTAAGCRSVTARSSSSLTGMRHSARVR
jgi:hypothetical protein